MLAPKPKFYRDHSYNDLVHLGSSSCFTRSFPEHPTVGFPPLDSHRNSVRSLVGGIVISGLDNFQGSTVCRLIVQLCCFLAHPAHRLQRSRSTGESGVCQFQPASDTTSLTGSKFTFLSMEDEGLRHPAPAYYLFISPSITSCFAPHQPCLWYSPLHVKLFLAWSL